MTQFTTRKTREKKRKALTYSSIVCSIGDVKDLDSGVRVGFGRY